MREICERYGLPYNTGPLRKQLGSVHKTILRLAFPGGNAASKRAAAADGPDGRDLRQALRPPGARAGGRRPCA